MRGGPTEWAANLFWGFKIVWRAREFSQNGEMKSLAMPIYVSLTALFGSKASRYGTGLLRRALSCIGTLKVEAHGGRKMRLSWASDGQPNRLNAWPASFDFEIPITQVHVPFMARAMEANIRDIVQDTVLELFDMLGKGEAG